MRNFLYKLFGRNGHDHLLTFTMLFLCSFGIIMIGSASVGESVKYGTMYPTSNMIKQGVFVVLGFIGYTFLVKAFRRKWINQKTIYFIMACGVAALLACRLFPAVKGSYAWIPLGFMTLQPSEFMKIIVILFLAFSFGDLEDAYYIDPRTRKSLKREREKIKHMDCFVKPVCICAVVFGIIALVQGDLGSALILAFICLMIFFCINKPYYLRYQRTIGFIMFLGVVGAGSLFMILKNVLAGYQLTRIMTWLHPLANPTTDGWQLVNSLISFSSGLLGKGFNASSQKFGYIPEANNDFIGAIVFEELGIIGLLCILVPYCIIIFKLFRYASLMKESKCKIYLYGVSAYFFAHLLVNMGGISGLIPMTGVPLLLVSSGGSSTICALGSLGIAQSMISTYNKSKLKEQL